MGHRDSYVVAIDQGTTSTRALVLDGHGVVVGRSRGAYELVAALPEPGWVELSPRRMWESVRDAIGDAVSDAGIDRARVAGLALANQGETVIAFDAADGAPLGAAISWQDRRSEAQIARWRADGLEAEVAAITGLRLDPYFSASKLAWILARWPAASAAAAGGTLRLGTSDSWLLWQLTGGRAFVTDAATASRTMLYDLRTRQWSPTLLAAFGVPASALPEIVANVPAGARLLARADLLGREVPITGLCVDQHAALFGHGCRAPGQIKATYGTGCFVLAAAGADPSVRADGLLTALGWHIGDDARYIIEGGVYSAGSIVEWLIRLGLIAHPADVDALAAEVADSRGVMMIPAFSGLAAPYWASAARASWLGMDEGAGRAHLVRAAMESIAFRVADIVAAMAQAGVRPARLRVDGGLSRSQFLMQCQAEVLSLTVDVCENPDVTALGVALMGGIGAGMWSADTLPEVAQIGGSFTGDPARISQRANDYRKWRVQCDGAAAAAGEALCT